MGVDLTKTKAFRPGRRFWRSRRGSTAVEFALVAGPFIALMVGVIELGMIFMASITLENAVAVASRQIRTGEVKTPSQSSQEATSLEGFRTSICSKMSWMQADCNANLSVDVETFTTFNNVTLTNPISAGTFNPGALDFKTGGPSAIVLVRAYYKWTLVAPMIHQGLEKIPGKTLLVSTTTFRNEPFPTT